MGSPFFSNADGEPESLLLIEKEETMIRLVLLAGLVLLGLTACRAAPPQPTPFPTASPTSPPVPTAAPTDTSIPEPVEVSMQVAAEAVNCRFGPGTVYQTLNEIGGGKLLRAIGRNEDFTWWLVRDPGNPGGSCWVSAEVIEELGETASLPVIPLPFVTVTDVSLRVEPSRIVVNCDQFPQTVFFEASITTNGPTLFTWKWEVSTGITSNVGTLIFEEAGTQVINEYYQINAPNEYWVKFYVLTPNERIQEVAFPVSCTP